MRWCIGACALLLQLAPAGASAAKRMSAEDILQLVSTSVAADDNDEAAARQLESIEPTEQLDGEAIGILKAQGAGRLTLRALDELRARSASLPPPPQPVVVLDAGLGAEQQRAMLTKINEYASGYVSALPNMSCTETTRFSSSGHQSGDHGARKVQARLPGGWRLEDTVVEDLDYFQGVETYHTRKVNGAPETAPLEELRSAYSRGEFGSVLAITFDSRSQASFQWDHWENLRGQRVAVFRYSVDRVHSQYWVCCVATGTMTVNGVRRQRYKRWLSAYQGFVYADSDTGSIVRLTFRNVEIPPEYNLQDARNLLEYAAVTLGEKSFWLPARAIHYTRTDKGRTRDEIQFSNYRKFGANTNITFPTDEK
jgi:hypothetical protein